jgi:hypothetical protein
LGVESLAQEVRDVLADAGLPVGAWPDRPGAAVSLGPDGKVWAAWRTARTGDLPQDPGEAASWHHGRVMRTMERAIVDILVSAGFLVEAEASRSDPFAVLVKGRVES